MNHVAAHASIRPEHLVPPSLTHLREAPVLASALLRKVEHCLAIRARFPHTLLVGPADSGKRSIAQSIAAELAVPLRTIDATLATSSDDLHATFKDAPACSVIVVSGLHAVAPGVLRDLARAVGRSPIANRKSRPHLPFLDPALARPERPAKPYAEFTVIATAREMPDYPQYLDWVEHRYFLSRTPVTETARVARLFARSGCQVDSASCRAIADFLVARRIRTVPGVDAIIEWMRSEGIRSVTWQTIDAMVPDLLRHQADPSAPGAASPSPPSDATAAPPVPSDVPTLPSNP